jgi:small basic protein (TIGR04137 family)
VEERPVIVLFFERVKLLKERGLWKEGQSPLGLPKTKGEE